MKKINEKQGGYSESVGTAPQVEMVMLRKSSGQVEVPAYELLEWKVVKYFDGTNEVYKNCYTDEDAYKLVLSLIEAGHERVEIIRTKENIYSERTDNG